MASTNLEFDSNKSRIKELRSAFEQKEEISPRKQIKGRRKTLQRELDHAMGELEAQRVFCTSLETQYEELVHKMQKKEQQMQEMEQGHKETVNRLKSKINSLHPTSEENPSDISISNGREIEGLKQQNAKLEKEATRLHSQIKQLQEELIVEENTKERRTAEDPSGCPHKETNTEEANALEEEHTGHSENVNDKDISEEIEIDPNEEKIIKLEAHLDALLITIGDFEFENENLKQDNQQLKEQLVGVIDMAENLESELHEEKQAHQETKKMAHSIQANSQLSSQSDTILIRSKTHPVVPPIPTVMQGGEESEFLLTSPTAKKKRGAAFLRKFGKSSKDNKSVMKRNSIPQSTQLPPVETRTVAAGPESKKEGMNGSSQTLTMTPHQMERELKVLVLLGESLQGALAKEKKEHQDTKKILEECKSKKAANNEEKSIGQVSSLNLLPSHVELSEKTRQKLAAIKQVQLFNVDETSFTSPDQMDTYELKNTVTEMANLLDFILDSVLEPSKP